MFTFKFLQLANELLSVLTTPFILIFGMTQCAERVVDFFREFTVHVDGLGHVCSFAQFDFGRHGNPKYFPGPTSPRPTAPFATSKASQTRQGKMEKSFLTFIDNLPHWQPSEQGSLYLSRILEFQKDSLGNGTSPHLDLGTKKVGDSLANAYSRRRSPSGLLLPVPILRRSKDDTDREADLEGECDSNTEPGGLIGIINKYYNSQSQRFD